VRFVLPWFPPVVEFRRMLRTRDCWREPAARASGGPATLPAMGGAASGKATTDGADGLRLQRFVKAIVPMGFMFGGGLNCPRTVP